MGRVTASSPASPEGTSNAGAEDADLNPDGKPGASLLLLTSLTKELRPIREAGESGDETPLLLENLIRLRSNHFTQTMCCFLLPFYLKSFFC